MFRATGFSSLPIIGLANITTQSDDASEALQTHVSNRQAAAANAQSQVNLISGGAGRTAFLLAFTFWVGTAAAGGSVTCTITGLLTNAVNLDLTWTTTQGDRIICTFPTGVCASGPATNITLTVPATGASGPACGVDAYGFQM